MHAPSSVDQIHEKSEVSIENLKGRKIASTLIHESCRRSKSIVEMQKTAR